MIGLFCTPVQFAYTHMAWANWKVVQNREPGTDLYKAYMATSYNRVGIAEQWA